MVFTFKTVTMFFSTELDYTLGHCSFCLMFLFWVMFCYFRVLCLYILKTYVLVAED